MNDDWIGYQWLAREFLVEPIQSFPVRSHIGKSRSRSTTDGYTTDSYLEQYRPTPTVAGHLTFAFKYEGIHLEFLSRLFQTMPKLELEQWLHSEPSGQYARRAGFFYEWLTGNRLDFPGVSVGNYVSALSDEDYLTRSEPINDSRWRVRNNLPGTKEYCPTVRRTERVREAEAFDCLAHLQKLETEFGSDVLLRSAVWLTIKESRASFQIEREESQTDRIKRFASVIERRLAEGADLLSPSYLAAIQAEILGERALRSGIRRSPVFVGETSFAGEVVHYVAPHWNRISGLLDGLREFAICTRARSPLCRAGVLSFGFVFIHPMADGNGRISRFLVNDTLRRDGASPQPYILPISATITRTNLSRAEYDKALERYSKSLLGKYRDACSFGPVVECEDGVKSNFQFSAYEEAHPFWAYPDLTSQCEYLAGVIRETLEVEMRQEAGFLLDLRETRARVKEVLEAPDQELDRIIRSIRQNQGIVSGRLITEFEQLSDSDLARKIADAVMRSE